MKRFGNTEVEKVRVKMQKTLNKLGEELGVNFKVGNIRYAYSQMNIKVEASPTEVGEDGKNAQQTEFEQMATMYEGNGAKPAWYGRTFIEPESGSVLKVVGWKCSARKNVIKLLDVDKNKEYISSIKFVAQYLK